MKKVRERRREEEDNLIARKQGIKQAIKFRTKM